MTVEACLGRFVLSDSDYNFFQLNELPQGAKTILKKLVTTLPHKVFGIRRHEKKQHNDVGTREKTDILAKPRGIGLTAEVSLYDLKLK